MGEDFRRIPTQPIRNTSSIHRSTDSDSFYEYLADLF